MIRSIISVAAMAFLVSCGDGNPFTDGDEEPTDPVEIPESLAGNLKSISFDADAETLSVEIYALDSTPIDVVYNRDATRDIGGYQAYTVQEDSLDRFFVAMVGESADGSVQAGIAGDGGQFNRVLQGAIYERSGGFDAPDIGDGPAAGQVSYAGNYVGMTNISTPVDPGGVDPSLIPGDPVMISGQIFLNANFADMAVNGAIYDRQLLLNTPSDLPDLALIVTEIDDNGSFVGQVEYDGEVGRDIGDYGGIFGGTDAASVGGAVNMNEFTDDVEDELERGFFVLTQCGLPDDAAICDNVAP